jgi:hypothetical protein
MARRVSQGCLISYSKGSNGRTNGNFAALFCSVLSSLRDSDVGRPNFPRLADLYSANVSVSVVPAQDE